jgi:hypothetical protein
VTVRGQTATTPLNDLLPETTLEPAVMLIAAAKGKYSYKCNGASPELSVQKYVAKDLGQVNLRCGEQAIVSGVAVDDQTEAWMKNVMANGSINKDQATSWVYSYKFNACSCPFGRMVNMSVVINPQSHNIITAWFGFSGFGPVA